MIVGGLQRQLFIPSAIALLLLTCVSCGQASRPPGEKFVKGKGPAGLDVNTEYAVPVKGPAEFTCTFAVAGPKAFVLYRRELSRQWEPKASCNNGAGETGGNGHLPPDGADWMITGWHAKDRVWRQCNFKGWGRDGDNEALVCTTLDGGWMKFTCPKGQCDKP
jgi:hypothetical protein